MERPEGYVDEATPRLSRAFLIATGLLGIFTVTIVLTLWYKGKAILLQGKSDDWDMQLISWAVVGSIICIPFVVSGLRRKAWYVKYAVREKQQKVYAKEQEQRDAMTTLLTVTKRAKETVTYLSQWLLHASQLLDRTDVHFQNNAFAPFWDDIEEAAKTLGGFEKMVNQLGSLQSAYAAAVPNLAPHESHSGFPVCLDDLPNPASVAQRLTSAVYTAQSNFHFASIYEQRRTRQVMIEGFQNLGEAIDGIGDRITESIGTLRESMSRDSHLARQQFAAAEARRDAQTEEALFTLRKVEKEIDAKHDQGTIRARDVKAIVTGRDTI